MPEETVEERLEAFADADEGFGEAVLQYYRDSDETLPPHHLLTTLRRVDDVALHFDSGHREWVLLANVQDTGEARYRYYDCSALDDAPSGEPRKAIELEDLLRTELPEIVDVQDTPLPDLDRRCYAGP